MWGEKRKDTKGVIRSRKTIKDGVYNGKKRKDKKIHRNQRLSNQNSTNKNVVI
jgi:hypothetical protein